MNRRSLKKRIRNAITNRKNRPLLYGVIFMIAAAATGLACGWSYVTDHSVRFNTYRSGRGFYRLPPLPIMYNAKNGKELSVREVENYDFGEGSLSESDYPDSAELSEEDQIWGRARTAAQEKRLDDARDLLNKYLAITADPSFEAGNSRQENRNTAYDILDAMAALKAGSTGDAVAQYINARYSYQYTLTDDASVDKNLADNWEYLKAAIVYSQKQNDAALEAFRAHASKYPRSEKNEAVLYMIAKLKMESSRSFNDNNCGDAETHETNGANLDASCRDESWNAAFAAFQDLNKRYPNGRYFNDARGWLAFLYERGGDRPSAMAEYYRLLGHPTDRAVRLKAKFDLQYLGHEQDDATLDAVEKLIANDANAALAYAYHRIYNHAIDLTYEEHHAWCCYGDERWSQEQDENKRVKIVLDAGNHELERIARFSTAMMKRHPNSKVGGGFVLRVAEAHLELRNYAEALNSADKALGHGISGDMRMEGLWVKGSSEHRLKHLKAARETFKKLIAEFPKTKLTEGAQRLLAMTAEDQDDLETALDIYIDLGYESDVAYFVDVLLPTDRLAEYVANRKDTPKYYSLLYALGVRYMRDKRWKEAKDTLQSVRTEAGPDGYTESDKNATWHFPKEVVFDSGTLSYIKTSWVMQDLKTIEILQYHERAVENAEGDEAKAEAMYQLASFLFEADDLVFYNPSLWKGGRSGALNELHFSNHERLVNESRIIFEHLNSHDAWARAIPIYEEIVARFPQTKTARDAMYSAAVAHERLVSHHGTWESVYERGLFAGSRIITYSDVKNAYPDYRLPRGTEGWEPSTRTVNGGPGWEPKPKPAPPLTRTQKFERRLKYVSGKFNELIKPRIDSTTGWIGSIFGGYISVVNSTLSWLLTVVGLLLTGYLALLAFHFRIFLSEAIARLAKPKTPLVVLPDSESRVEKVIGDD